MFEMPTSSVPEALLQKPTIIETVLSFLRRGPYRGSNPLSSSPVIPLYEVNLWLSFDTRAKNQLCELNPVHFQRYSISDRANIWYTPSIIGTTPALIGATPPMIRATLPPPLPSD